MSAPAYAAAAADYEHRWKEMVVAEGSKARAALVAREIHQNKVRYLEVQKALGVPWYFVGLVHYREADLNWFCHLANGDSLRKRTVHVPKGRIPHRSPPYTWEEGAIDALECRGLQRVRGWTFARLCYELEAYNGWGYRSKGVTSPYLWAHSNQHVAGKYVRDHVYDPRAVDRQLGTLPVLKALMDLDQGIIFTGPVEPVLEPVAKPTIDLPPPPATDAPPRKSLLWSAVARVGSWFLPSTP